jgi:hypothetical protein
VAAGSKAKSWPLGYWDRGFESRSSHGCLCFCVVFPCVRRGHCADHSLVWRSPTKCLHTITKPPVWGGQGPYKDCSATDDDDLICYFLVQVHAGPWRLLEYSTVRFVSGAVIICVFCRILNSNGTVLLIKLNTVRYRPAVVIYKEILIKSHSQYREGNLLKKRGECISSWATTSFSGMPIRVVISHVNI